jgi:catechol 2,3-dioxygenase-like lactoylglutathione lyase family enzyme
VRILGIDHVQLSIPEGGEDAARDFYEGILGLTEVPKPRELAARGGRWFAAGGTVHLGSSDFRPAAPIALSSRTSTLRTTGAAGARSSRTTPTCGRALLHGRPRQPDRAVGAKDEGSRRDWGGDLGLLPTRGEPPRP